MLILSLQSTQQFFAPSSYYQGTTAQDQSSIPEGVTASQEYSVNQSEQPARDYSVSQPAQDYSVSQPAQDYSVSQPAQDYSVSQPAQVKPTSLGQTSGQTTSIADMLAAASDRALDRCGYQYDEYLDMFYDANSNLYYHQVSRVHRSPYRFQQPCSLTGIQAVLWCRPGLLLRVRLWK